MFIGEDWAVALEGLTKIYPTGWRRRPVIAVQGLTLKVAPGRVLGLLGPNGSGKSTTLKILAGLIRPTAGQARICGRPAGDREARVRVGYVPESLTLALHQTGRSFLNYCAGLSSLPPEHAAARIDTVLAWTGLGEAAERPVSTYSKGQRQRLGLAQAVLHEPAVLLLDEPMSGLDPEGRIAVARLIRERARQGCAIVLTSHLLAQAEEICDRLALLGGGRLLVEAATADLLGGGAPEPAQPSRLEKLYLEKLHGLA